MSSGHASGQESLFGTGEGRMEIPQRKQISHEERARKKLGRVLEEARSATTMPWSQRDLKFWLTVFPQMSNWLPEPEREEMRAAFRAEMERLGAV